MDLVDAIEHNDIDRVRVLLDEGVDPNIQDQYGYAVLIYASEYGYIDVVNVSLEYGADPNIQTIAGNTALMIASRYNDIDAVKILLEYDADPNIQSDAGTTAYIWSRDDDTREILRSYIAKYGKSIYQMKDRSREYMSSVYSDISIIV